MGDAKDGLRDADCGPSFRGAGIRLGVVGASIGIDVVGDVLRRFAAESAIADIWTYDFPSMVYQTIYTPLARAGNWVVDVDVVVVVVGRC